MLDLEEYQSLDGYNLPSAVYLSPLQTPPQSSDGYFMFLQFGAQMYVCAWPKRK